MKRLRFLSALVCLVLAMSCSSDDSDNRPRLTYTLSASADIISTINFKGFNGEQAEVAPDLAIPGWSQQIRVNLPFTAVLNTELSNASTEAAAYTLSVIVNDSVVGQKTGIVEAGGVLSETLSADANP